MGGLDHLDDNTGLDKDYSPGRTGAGAHVYVLDTGVRTSHTDFGGRAIPTLEVVGNGIVECAASNTKCADDANGHGTHTDGGAGSFSWFIEAIDWVMKKGEAPAIISASLGGRVKLQTVSDIIKKAVEGGISVVVAAGNDGSSAIPNACEYSPARAPHTITVGSTTISEKRS